MFSDRMDTQGFAKEAWVALSRILDIHRLLYSAADTSPPFRFAA